MGFEISERVQRSLNKTQKTPGLVLIFDGIEQVFGSVLLKSYYLFDDGHFFDDGGFFDTLTAFANQDSAIAFGGGSGGSTTTKLEYKIDPDMGIGDAISSMKFSLVNNKKNSIVGLLQDYELMGRKVRVRLTPDVDSAVYPQDYITIFRGIVDELSWDQGLLNLSLSHPDQKKRQTIFVEATTELTDAIDDADTSIAVTDTSDFLFPIFGPGAIVDNSFIAYVRIDDEIIFFNPFTSTATQLNGCVRGSLFTQAVAHEDEAEVRGFYILEGNSMDLAMKVMLSGWNGNFVENIPATLFTADDEVVFDNRDLLDECGLTPGDVLTSTGATNGANNVEEAEITAVSYDKDLNTTTVTVAGAGFVFEENTSAVVGFRSKYDTLPSGLRMSPDEVDVAEHERLRDLFLSNADYSFYLDSTIDNGKDWLSQEIYKPIAAFAVPKNTRASVGYTIPPLPDEELITITSDMVKMPEKLKHIRQLGRNFYNTIIYKLDEEILESEKFRNGIVVTDTESRERIPIGNKVFKIDSLGLRSNTIASNAAQRRLFRYKFAASQIENLKILFGDGFTIDIGDLVYVDSESLQIADVNTGATNFGVRIFQVVKKTLDIRTGDMQLVLLDTNFNNTSRYGYISPSSVIDSVDDDKTFTLRDSFGSTDEASKWSDWVGAAIQVRNADFSVTATGIIESVSSDGVIVLQNNLAISPSAEMVMDLSDYNDQVLDRVKLIYTHITNGSANFDDGGAPYFMI